jgi:hypothetical protein
VLAYNRKIVKSGLTIMSAKSKTPRPAGEAMKRFTIDVPVSLHTRIKTQCAKSGVKMADKIRALLERAFPATKA